MHWYEKLVLISMYVLENCVDPKQFFPKIYEHVCPLLKPLFHLKVNSDLKPLVFSFLRLTRYFLFSLLFLYSFENKENLIRVTKNSFVLLLITRLHFVLNIAYVLVTAIFSPTLVSRDRDSRQFFWRDFTRPRDQTFCSMYKYTYFKQNG